MWNGSEESWNVRGDSEEDNVTDCGDGDSDTDWYRKTECDMLHVLSV